MSWKAKLNADPVHPLLASINPALVCFTNRDLLARTGNVEELWESHEVQRMVAAQQPNGCWRYPGPLEHVRSQEDYNQFETYRMLRILVEQFGINRCHPVLTKAADFLFSHQTSEGDFRGICGNQYVPYYSAAMMELLIKAGYSSDYRIKKGFTWLISIRQNDGGWAFPLRTVGLKLSRETFRSKTIQPDKSKPFSHLVTGIVLRAFAAHPKYRKSKEALLAGKLLASRFFKPDKYPDRRAPSFWTSFSFPFWFTDLLSSLDSLSMLELPPKDPQIANGIGWIVSRQGSDGVWRLPLRIMKKQNMPDLWITLAICRILKRFYEPLG